MILYAIDSKVFSLSFRLPLEDVKVAVSLSINPLKCCIYSPIYYLLDGGSTELPKLETYRLSLIISF